MHPVLALLAFLDSLRTTRAVANARHHAELRVREDWLVDGLCLRLERSVRATEGSARPASEAEGAVGQP